MAKKIDYTIYIYDIHKIEMSGFNHYVYLMVDLVEESVGEKESTIKVSDSPK